jgi:hypothetical protein
MRAVPVLVCACAVASAAPARDWPVQGKCLTTTTGPRGCVQVSRDDAPAIHAAVLGVGRDKLRAAAGGDAHVVAQFVVDAKRPNTESTIGGLRIQGFRSDVVQVAGDFPSAGRRTTIIVFVQREASGWRVVGAVGHAVPLVLPNTYRM